MSMLRPAYSLEPLRGNARDAGLYVIDADLLAASARRTVKLRLPHTVTDDHTLVERQAEKRGELGRHRSDCHDRRPIASHDGALRLAGNSEPFESGAVACEREILFVGNRTGFAVRVAAEQRNEPVSLCEGRVANNQPAHEAVHDALLPIPKAIVSSSAAVKPGVRRKLLAE